MKNPKVEKVDLEQINDELSKLDDEMELLHRKNQHVKEQLTEMDFLMKQEQKTLLNLKAIWKHGEMRDIIEDTQLKLRANKKSLSIQMEDEMRNMKRHIRVQEDKEIELLIQRKHLHIGERSE